MILSERSHRRHDVPRVTLTIVCAETNGLMDRGAPTGAVLTAHRTRWHAQSWLPARGSGDV